MRSNNLTRRFAFWSLQFCDYRSAGCVSFEIDYIISKIASHSVRPCESKTGSFENYGNVSGKVGVPLSCRTSYVKYILSLCEFLFPYIFVLFILHCSSIFCTWSLLFFFKHRHRDDCNNTMGKCYLADWLHFIYRIIGVRTSSDFIPLYLMKDIFFLLFSDLRRAFSVSLVWSYMLRALIVLYVICFTCRAAYYLYTYLDKLLVTDFVYHTIIAFSIVRFLRVQLNKCILLKVHNLLCRKMKLFRRKIYC